MRAVTIGVTMAAVVVAAGLGVLQAADAVPVTIAVLRGDGILVPIATKAGDKWGHTWPLPAKAADVPLGLDDIPKRWWGKVEPTRTWHAWQIDGTASEVAAERPTWYLAHCKQGVGILTSLTARPPVPPPTVQPYPKLGLATTSPLPIQRIEPVDRSATIWPAVTEAMTAALTKAEDGMDGRPRMGLGLAPKHPMPAAERAKVPVRVESLYRMPLGSDRFLYYVEATKRYGMPAIAAGDADRTPSPRRRDGCSTMTFAEGWFVAGAEGKLPAALEFEDVRLTSCDYDGVWLMLPLGYIADGPKPLWVAQLTSSDAESYIVLRWEPEKDLPMSVSLTPGGSCEPE